MSACKTCLKQTFMWLMNHQIISEPLCEWAIKKFDLKEF